MHAKAFYDYLEGRQSALENECISKLASLHLIFDKTSVLWISVDYKFLNMTDQEPKAKSRPAKRQKNAIDENAVAKFRRGEPIATKIVRTCFHMPFKHTCYWNEPCQLTAWALRSFKYFCRSKTKNSKGGFNIPKVLSAKLRSKLPRSTTGFFQEKQVPWKLRAWKGLGDSSSKTSSRRLIQVPLEKFLIFL